MIQLGLFSPETRMRKVITDLAPWASAAQEDPHCCKELKDIFKEVIQLDGENYETT